ncbi:MAG: asparagine synthase-related protein [Gaiellaceae bacterium]
MTASGNEGRRARRFELTPLEVVTGGPLGIDAKEPALPAVEPGLTPRAALEEAVRVGLANPPCLVTFSGGRDSAALLALAASIARQEGLPLPIPSTLRIPDTPGLDEAAWQERLVSELALEDWARIEIGEQADYVGPFAQRLLLRDGLFVQPWARLIIALQLGPARGGSLITGIGGDPILGGWQSARISEVVAGHAWPRPADLPRLGAMVAPDRLRRRLLERRLRRPPWLRREPSDRWVAAYAAERASRPHRWDRYLEWRLRLCRSTSVEWAVARLAEAEGALILHPFQDRRFVSALARQGGARGLGDRTRLMRILFSDLLPEEILARPTKAIFTLAHFRRSTRSFARRWDGQGFDPELVDVEELRRSWLAPVVNPTGTIALQWAWLDSARRGLEQLPADLVDDVQPPRTS